MSSAVDNASDGGRNMLDAASCATMETEGSSDLESSLRSANEKNRNFLTRLKDLTQMNRSITDLNKELKEENDRLTSELALTKSATEQLKTEVDECWSDKLVLASLGTEVEDLRKQIHNDGLTIKRLTTACEEKNRRIDLLAHRKHQRQKGGDSWKDGCDGYRSSESPSIDSESSASVATTSDELTCEDLFLAEDFQLRYRRLLNEKLMLEKVHSEAQLLVLQLKNENKDYQNKVKLLTDSVHELREQLYVAELREEDLQVRLEEVQLENEHLEFQVLEMEVQKEEELESSSDADSHPSSTGLTPSKISSSIEVTTRLLKLDLEETTEAQTGQKRLMDKQGSLSDNDFSGLHIANTKLTDLNLSLKDNSKTHGRRDGLEPASSSSSGDQTTHKTQTVASTTSETHLEHASTGLSKTHVEPYPSELATMITPPDSKNLKFRGLTSSNGTMTHFSDDLDFRDKSIDSDDSLWATVEDPENSIDLGLGRSSEFWKEVEERMGFNVDDITLILEFEDSFPNEVDDTGVRHTSQDSTPLSDHDNDDSFSLPPPLPLSLPPVEVERDKSPSERSVVVEASSQDAGNAKSREFTQVEVEEFQKSDVLHENDVESLTVESKMQSKSDSTASADQLLQWIDGPAVGDFHDSGKDFASYESEIASLKRQIVDLEKQLSAAQDECLNVIRSKENLSGDFERVKKVIEEKERDMKSAQKEFEKLLSEKNSQMAAKSDRSRLIDSATQTLDDEEVVKLQHLLQIKDRELTAKANEADSLSREMREWQRKVTMAGDKDTEMTQLLNSIRKDLESITHKEREARLALEEVLEREKRLQVEKGQLEESVASLQVDAMQKEVISREKEIMEQRMDELEHSLRLKGESESSLIHEIASLKHRIDDLQSSLKLLQEKEFDFQSLEQKYENLGNLTRRLQTAVAPMKARIARLALRCKTKDELIRKMLKALRRHGNGESPLDAEVEREVMGASTDDYTRPLSPLTVSHLDQINHEILKLDLTSNDKSFPNLSIPPNSYNNNNVPGEFPGSVTLLNTAGDMRHNSVTTGSQTTRYVDDRPSNVVSMSSRRHVTLLDSGDFDDVTRDDRARTGKVTNHFANSDYRSFSVARISPDKADDGFFSSGKEGHNEFGRSLRAEKSGVDVVATENRFANVLSIPEPPGDFHVEKVSRNGSVLLGWTPPVSGDVTHSRENAVAGYKVYVNGRETLFVGSHLATKVLLKSLNLNAIPICFTLRTVTENGHVSRPVDVYLDHALLKKCLTDDFVESVASDDIALSSATSSPLRHEVNGHRKMFLAIYDYNPSAVARVEGQGAELSFQTGDIIVTYGPMRSDGYYVGKVRGRRGLVPGSFIEELAPFTSQDVKTVTSNGQPVSGVTSTNGMHLANRRSRSVGAGLNILQSKQT